MKLEELVGKPITEAQFDEAAGKKDACYRKVKARYDVWPSAYASGALVKCRKVGAKNWGNKSKKESVDKFKKLPGKVVAKRMMSIKSLKPYASIIAKKKTKVKMAVIIYPSLPIISSSIFQIIESISSRLETKSLLFFISLKSSLRPIRANGSLYSL